ncbi:hypothetical protein C8Q74DRAFT_315984 [Fomes fomentarius]|nr:hypothetical protein C8Q74DRAFT_315984 [Fomes fomentarius]
MSSSQRASRSPAHSANQRDSGAPTFEPELANLPSSVSRSQASPSMIGPPPSFYDPNQAVVPEGPNYEQWVMEHYGSGSSQYTYAQGGGMAGNVQFPQQSQLHHVPVAPAQNPGQSQYPFVQEYTDQGARYDSHHLVGQPGPADRPQRALPSSRIPQRGGAPVSYSSVPQIRVPGAPSGSFQQSQQSPAHQQPPFGLQQTPGAEYYYPEVPRAAEQQQPQPQPHIHSSYNFVGYQPEQHPSTSAYTPTSELTALSSSVSTPSHNPAGHGRGQGSSSRNPSGSAARGRGRGKTKRARVDDAHDGEDSDTQSDDDRPFGMDGGFTTVSVPPPQGQSMPSRL